MLRDAIGRDWQCGTTQVDFNLPERFEAFYIAPDGQKKTPVMIHRAICGSMERFLGILLEHYAGHLPLWLAPVQAVIATITSDADDYAREVLAAAQRSGCAPKSTYATRRSITRCASTRSPRCRCCWWSAEGGGRAHGLDPPARQGGQTVMPLDAALQLLADEAMPPDLKRVRKAAA